MKINSIGGAKKTKPIAGLWPEAQSTKHEIRNNFTKQSRFEKGQNERKFIYERIL